MQLRSASVRPGRGAVGQVDAQAVGHRQAGAFADQHQHGLHAHRVGRCGRRAPPGPGSRSPAAPARAVGAVRATSAASSARRGRSARAARARRPARSRPRARRAGSRPATPTPAAARGRAGAGTRRGRRPGWSPPSGSPMPTSAHVGGEGVDVERLVHRVPGRGVRGAELQHPRVGSALPAAAQADPGLGGPPQRVPEVRGVGLAGGAGLSSAASRRRDRLSHRGSRQLAQRRGRRVDRQAPAPRRRPSRAAAARPRTRARAAARAPART